METESNKNSSALTISLCMIVKNEEDTIGRCLESAKNIVDEIIIVDTGSTDNTKRIVSNFTDKIYDFIWVDDFALARNYAFSKAKKDYILWLDADDIILEADQIKFIDLKNNLELSIDSVTMNYNLAANDQGEVISSIRRNRIVKRSCNFKWIGAVHEYLEVTGNIVNSDISITHSKIHPCTDRNIRIYENRLADGENFTPRDLYYYANELYDHQKYDRAIIFYQKFLDSNEGWLEDNISACGKLSDCYLQLGNNSGKLKFIFKSFEYDTPRAEFLCRLGYHFMQLERYKEAIYWYKLATELEIPSQNWGLINHSCWTWLPLLQLCLCYDKIGQHYLAYKHNELARKYIPDDKNIKHNKQYFENKYGFTDTEIEKT